MYRLRPEVLLLALVLTVLPARFAHAWPADSRTPSRSRVEITTIDIQEGVGAFDSITKHALAFPIANQEWRRPLVWQ
jgi:hypothetical protein